MRRALLIAALAPSGARPRDEAPAAPRRPRDLRHAPGRGRATRRALLIAALALLALAAPAGAHPLGNFSINHLDVVRASADRVDVRYVLDQAEIPTFQERGLRPAQVLARKRADVARGVSLTVGGRPVALALRPGGRVSFPMGAGGLRTTRVELLLEAKVAARGPVVVRDATFPGRVGWRAVLVAPGRGTAVRTDVTSADPTRRLHVYPTALLTSPADRTVAHLTVAPGVGTVTAPAGDGSSATTRDRGAGDSFGSVFERAASGQGVLLLLLLAAFGWGAIHALSPGHGKAMVAAYLVGTRGTPRHAVALGLTVTITHTIGVFALGLVTLALSAYVLPEQLYPWLNLASGLLVLVVGGSVVRSRVRQARAPRGGHDDGHQDDHGHEHDRGHGHEHGHQHPLGDGHGHDHGDQHEQGHQHPLGDGHGHDHGDQHEHEHDHGHQHGRGHHHHHHGPEDLRPRALLAMGASAGLIPCPSALVVLLGAVAQHQIGLGLVLIVAFSAGLAATLTALGLAVVAAGRVTSRLSGARSARVLAVLPALSSLAIVAVGLALTVQAVPKVV
jgi:nickel/cobalt exporter